MSFLRTLPIETGECFGEHHHSGQDFSLLLVREAVSIERKYRKAALLLKFPLAFL